MRPLEPPPPHSLGSQPLADPIGGRKKRAGRPLEEARRSARVSLPGAQGAKGREQAWGWVGAVIGACVLQEVAGWGLLRGLSSSRNGWALERPGVRVRIGAWAPGGGS